MIFIDDLYWEDYVALMAEEATLPLIEPPYLNPRRGPGFGKRQPLRPPAKKRPQDEN